MLYSTVFMGRLSLEDRSDSDRSFSAKSERIFLHVGFEIVSAMPFVLGSFRSRAM